MGSVLYRSKTLLCGFFRTDFHSIFVYGRRSFEPRPMYEEEVLATICIVICVCCLRRATPTSHISRRGVEDMATERIFHVFFFRQNIVNNANGMFQALLSPHFVSAFFKVLSQSVSALSISCKVKLKDARLPSGSIDVSFTPGSLPPPQAPRAGSCARSVCMLHADSLVQKKYLSAS